MNSSRRVLIFSAHADDEVLGAAGAIAHHAVQGDDVRVIICADCRAARPGHAAAPALLPAAEKAAEVLGALEVVFLGYRGMTLGQDVLGLTRAIEAELRTSTPHIVYTHHAHDLNSDHRAVSRAVMVATRPFGAHRPARVLHFEVPSSTGWETPATFAPSVFLSLSEALLDKKLAAMACYAEEMRPAPHPRSLEALRVRAAYWGQQCGCAYAEPYMLMREVM